MELGVSLGDCVCAVTLPELGALSPPAASPVIWQSGVPGRRRAHAD
jgi:hypothetical protein